MTKYKLITILTNGANLVNKLPLIENDEQATNIFDEAFSGILSIDPTMQTIKSLVMWDGGREVCRWPALDSDIREVNEREAEKVQGTIEKVYWNGLETQAVRGSGIVADQPDVPLYWGRHLVGQRIDVVLVNLEGVNQGGGVMLLDNSDGSGWLKITEGMGSPRWPHRNLLIEEGSFQPI